MPRDRLRRKMKKIKKHGIDKVFLFVKVLILVLPVFVWLQMEESSFSVFSSRTAQPGYAPSMPLSHDQRVNRMLREVDEKLRWESAKVEVENYRYAPDVDVTRSDDFHFDESLQFGIKEQENVDILAGAGGDETQRPTYVLDEAINTRLWSAEVRNKQIEKANEEYVKTFLENARRAGYQVTLDQDFRIQSVRKIRRGKPLF